MFHKLSIFPIIFLSLIVLVQPGSSAQEEEYAAQNPASFALDHPNLLRKVSLDLRDINVADAIRYLTEKAGLNVAINSKVTGRVTLSLKNVTIRDALQIILLTNDLAIERRGDILYVMLSPDYELLHGEKWVDARQVKVEKLNYARAPDVLAVLNPLKSKIGNVVVDPESGTVVLMDTPERIAAMSRAVGSLDQKFLTQVFQLQYAKASDLEKNLKARLDEKQIGSIRADEQSNQVVVTSLPQRMDEVAGIIDELDKKPRQVLIEAKIYRVTLKPGFNMGINWQYIFNEAKKHAVDIVMQFPVTAVLDNFAQLTTKGSIERDKYSVVVKLLQTMGETKNLSSPRITALNNQEAKIMIGTKEAYVTQTVVQATSSATTAENVTFIDVGVQLYVTPTINDEEFITMKIRPVVSAVERELKTASGNTIPIVSTQEEQTVVRVKDSRTIIMGGLIKEETLRTTKQFPVLANIPILGNAFKQTDTKKENTELVIFLTPHIITGEQDMPDWEDRTFKGPRMPILPKKKESAVEKLRRELVDHYNLGLYFVQQTKFKQAIKEFEKVLAIDPMDADTQYNLGILYDKYMRNAKKALEHYRAFLRIKPDSEESQRVTEWTIENERVEPIRK